MAKERVARSTSFAAPVGGWNTKDSLDQMPATDAIILKNVFPSTSGVKIRNGFTTQATGLGSAAVQTLIEHNSADGTRKLLAAANGNIYDASTFGGAASSLGSGFTSNRWQTTCFRNNTIFVNGVDTPQKYDGATLGAAAYTVIATPANLINVCSFSNRLYFIEKNTGKVWYGSVDAITGALTSFDVSSLLERGGYLQWCGSWTTQGADGASAFFVIISSNGEVLLYSGDYPGSPNWAIVGHYYISNPLSYRCGIHFGPDVLIMTEMGLVPLSTVLTSDTTQSALGQDQGTIGKIQTSFREAAGVYKSNFMWQACFYPKGNYMIFNIPIATDTLTEQYVLNVSTGAWCQFTGMNACSWAVANEKLYFGGTDGKVYLADYGANDNNNSIPVDIKTSYQYFGDRESLKRFLMLRPLISGDTATSFSINLDCDFVENQATDSISITGSSGSSWDTATWDTDGWDSSSGAFQNWYSIAGIGRCASIRLKGSYLNAQFQISAFNITYEKGGLF